MIAIVSVASGRDLYVDNRAGDDRFDGSIATSVDPGRGPFRTISRAVCAAQAGDRILLANTGSAYREGISLVGSPHSGTAYSPFVIEGQGAGARWFSAVTPGAWQFAVDDVFRFQPERKQFQELFLNGYPVKRVETTAANAVAEVGTARVGAGGRVDLFLRRAGQTAARLCATYAKLSVGITVYKADDVLVHNLTVQGFQLDGINFHDATGPCRLIEVTSRNNGRSGVAVVGASTVELHSCTLTSNAICQLFMDDYSTCDLIHCELAGDRVAKWLIGKHAVLNVDGVPVSSSLALPR